MPRVFKATEHAFFIVILLTLQRDHEPLKSSTLSRALNVSDSYLKKTVRKLSAGGIVNATTGPGGGIKLARSVDQITLGDICRVMNEGPWTATVEDLKQKSLISREGAAEALYGMASAITEAGKAFDNVLNSHTVSEYLPDGSWQNGTLDWNEFIRQYDAG